MFRSTLLRFRFSIPQFNASKDYYKILGVPKTASENDIKKAFFKLAKKYHPDMSKGNKSHEALFKDANEAYSVLSDQKLKADYDAASNGPSYSSSQNPFSGFTKQNYQNNPYQSNPYQSNPQQQRYRWTQQQQSNTRQPNWNDPSFQAEILNQLFRMQNQAKARGGNKNYDFVRQTMEQFTKNQQQANRQAQEDYLRRFEEELRRSYEARQQRTKEMNEKIQKFGNMVKQGVANVATGVADLAAKAKDWWNRRK